MLRYRARPVPLRPPSPPFEILVSSVISRLYWRNPRHLSQKSKATGSLATPQKTMTSHAPRPQPSSCVLRYIELIPVKPGTQLPAPPNPDPSSPSSQTPPPRPPVPCRPSSRHLQAPPPDPSPVKCQTSRGSQELALEEGPTVTA